MSEEQKTETLLEKAEKEFNEEVDMIENLPLYIYNYISELKKKLASMSDCVEILKEDKKILRDSLNENSQEKIKLHIQKEHMLETLHWFIEPDRPIGSDAEKINTFKEMVIKILDE